MSRNRSRSDVYSSVVCKTELPGNPFENPQVWWGGTRNRASTMFYVDLEESCRRRAAQEVSQLNKTSQEMNTNNNEEDEKAGLYGAPRRPSFINNDNINRIEQYVSDHYKEAVYQKLWENAQHAVFHGIP